MRSMVILVSVVLVLSCGHTDRQTDTKQNHTETVLNVLLCDCRVGVSNDKKMTNLHFKWLTIVILY